MLQSSVKPQLGKIFTCRDMVRYLLALQLHFKLLRQSHTMWHCKYDTPGVYLRLYFGVLCVVSGVYLKTVSSSRVVAS